MKLIILLIRQVVVPGITDSREYIESLSKYLKQFNNIEKIEFLPYHKLGREKYIKLGIQYMCEDIVEMDKDKCDNLYSEFMKIYKG